MTDIVWTRPKACTDNACPRWRIHPDGSLEIGTTDTDATVLLSRADALRFVDAARRGEVIPPGR